MKKHVFITGINGQLGSSLASGFIESDWILYGMDLNKSDAINAPHFLVVMLQIETLLKSSLHLLRIQLEIMIAYV